jgi:hypothetical protein
MHTFIHAHICTCAHVTHLLCLVFALNIFVSEKQCVGLPFTSFQRCEPDTIMSAVSIASDVLLCVALHAQFIRAMLACHPSRCDGFVAFSDESDPSIPT